jgi:hypothetical protein
MTATPPAKIATSDTGTPPKSPAGRSPYARSGLAGRRSGSDAGAGTAARGARARRSDGTARGTRPERWRLRERRADLDWPAMARGYVRERARAAVGTFGQRDGW